MNFLYSAWLSIQMFFVNLGISIMQDFAEIMAVASANTDILLVVAGVGVVSAILSAIICVIRKELIEDIIFAAIFGLIFNVLGLLFVFFRKPVWNNLGWIPVVAAWFILDANATFAAILVVYAIIWMFTQHELIDRIKIVEE